MGKNVNLLHSGRRDSLLSLPCQLESGVAFWLYAETSYDLAPAPLQLNLGTGNSSQNSAPTTLISAASSACRPPLGCLTVHAKHCSPQSLHRPAGVGRGQNSKWPLI